MTTSIQQLPKDCLVYIFQYIPPDEREKLKEVCQHFRKIVLDPFFTKERITAINIAKVASQYPKSLVKALGGPKAIFDFPAVDLTPNEERKFFCGQLRNPSRGKNHPFILLKIESTIPGVIQSVMLKKVSKKNSYRWVWQNEFRFWRLGNHDYDYVRRLFTNEACGYKGFKFEANRLNNQGQTTMALYKKNSIEVEPPIATQLKLPT
jgi:hypothetical protein